jgi:hypothetical protein
MAASVLPAALAFMACWTTVGSDVVMGEILVKPRSA